MTDQPWAFEAEYTSSKDLRGAMNLRHTRLQHGSTNIAETGHHQNSGVIDRHTLCTFRPRDRVCLALAAAAPAGEGASARTSSANQRAVRQETVHRQVFGSFRSEERRKQRLVEQNNRLQQARCAQLISTSING